jgi:hypothetical protein
MLFTYMTYSAYELYVALLDALISVAVALSVVVSLDRVFHVVKYAQLKARGRVTGRKPEDYYQFDPLPDPVRPRLHPAPTNLMMGSRTCDLRWLSQPVSLTTVTAY